MPQALIFELDGVRVTPAIVQVGEISYQVANIGSVRVAQFREYNRLSIFSILIGAALIIAPGVFNGTLPVARLTFIEWGAAAMLLGIALQLTWPRWVFALMLKMSTREVEALTSYKSTFVFDIKRAIEGAFIIRARLGSHPN